jgi:hypothetical protein
MDERLSKNCLKIHFFKTLRWTFVVGLVFDMQWFGSRKYERCTICSLMYRERRKPDFFYLVLSRIDMYIICMIMKPRKCNIILSHDSDHNILYFGTGQQAYNHTYNVHVYARQYEVKWYLLNILIIDRNIIHVFYFCNYEKWFYHYLISIIRIS